MFVDIIQGMDLNGPKKTLLVSMATAYENNLPETLSMNHYELAKELGYSHPEWKEFLKMKEVERLIESEIANIAEIGARRALENLQSGKASSSDIQAAKEVLANSRLLRQKHNQKPLIVITRIPKKGAIADGNAGEVH